MANLDAAAAGYITLGGDLRVPRLGFGAMHLTGEGVWGPSRDPAAARGVLKRAVQLGVRFIDTADSYGPAVSEEIIAEALHPYAGDLVIATKGGIVRPDRPTWAPEGRPGHLRAACEASLRRLRVDRIDLYQLHTIDPRVPLEESVGELARLQQEGKIRHVGVSNFDVDQLARARRIVPIVSVQNRYNVADRAADDVLDICARDGIAFIPWRPLALASADAARPARRRLDEAAAQRGWSVPQAALAWLLARSPVMLPIPGTSSEAHLDELIAASALRLRD
jgi:aryl-alcohol dehydrogenase-like predicted oxidoreductase